MKATKNKTIHPVVENLLKIARDNNIKQETIAKYAEIERELRKIEILSKNAKLTSAQVANLAKRKEILNRNAVKLAEQSLKI